MYCVSHAFSVPSTAYVVLICLNVFTGTVATLAVSTLEMYKDDVPDLEVWYDILSSVCPWVLPNYCLGQGLIMIASTHFTNRICDQFSVCSRIDVFSHDACGQYLVHLVWACFYWFALNLMLEYKMGWEFLRNLVHSGWQGYGSCCGFLV